MSPSSIPPVEVAHTCSCGRQYTPQTWQALPYVGIQDDGVERLELRNCVCGSTRARELTCAICYVVDSCPIDHPYAKDPTNVAQAACAVLLSVLIEGDLSIVLCSLCSRHHSYVDHACRKISGEVGR